MYHLLIHPLKYVKDDSLHRTIHFSKVEAETSSILHKPNAKFRIVRTLSIFAQIGVWGSLLLGSSVAKENHRKLSDFNTHRRKITVYYLLR